MKSTDIQIKDREIYFIKQTNSLDWIIRLGPIEGEKIRCYNYISNYKSYTNGYTPMTWGDVKLIKAIREATTEEKPWFEACEKAGEFVERPKIVENYEIY